VAALADQIGDYPVFFSLLQLLYGKPSELRPPEPASEEDRDHGVVALAA